MVRDSIHGYVIHLEQVIRQTHFDLQEGIGQFKELCLKVTPERKVPVSMITDIRQAYKQIQEQITKIKGVRQILEGKYREFYHRDSHRDREILEYAFLAQSLYSKFEYTLKEIEARRSERYGEIHPEMGHQPAIFPWFRLRENQVILLKTLQGLHRLDYTIRPDFQHQQKRVVDQGEMRSISLFILSAERNLIDYLQSRTQLREHDIKERYARDEFRGALTHLREITSSEVEGVIRRFTNNDDFLRLKCLILSIRSPKDLENKLIGAMGNIINLMKTGEVKTLVI